MDQREHRRHLVRVVRDVVEVVAILAAGIWAFYVFVYENRIKPGFEEPELNFTVTMHKVSEYHGLIGVHVNLGIQNVGPVGAHVLGFALSVYGQRIVALPVAAKPRIAPSNNPNSALLEAFYRRTPPVPVYAYAYVTKLADPRSTEDFEQDAGASTTEERVFFVPANTFDILTARIDVAYIKTDYSPPATKLRRTPEGFTVVTDRPTQNSDFPVSTLDLRSP